jgi:deoxyxylulose-5-phosphate synthase
MNQSLFESNPNPIFGKVYLVGAGPGDPGLMTIKGKTLLEHADVVIYDALVSSPILQMINPQAERIDAGKRRGRHSKLQDETNQLLIKKAQTHAVVVRLKGGDPFVFGRGGEEMEALIQAGISVEVIDLRTVRPLDYDTVIASVKKTNRLVILEEAWPLGSIATELTYMVQQKAFDYLDAPVKRITTPDAPAPYSAALFAEWFPKLETVKQEIKKAMYIKA